MALFVPAYGVVLVEEALREKLLTQNKAETNTTTKQVVLKTVGGNGVMPGVELDNNAALLDLMEQN